jgi:thymidylate synthase (FAD)
MPLFLESPTVRLIGRPTFLPPDHLAVDWRGEADDGERLAEFGGRMCYQSWANPARRTNEAYLENILRQGHGSVFEHASYVLMIEGVSRSLTHELIRHRSGTSVSQLSQRYVDESDVAFVIPPALLDPGVHPRRLERWKDARVEVLKEYQETAHELRDLYLARGLAPREARIAAYEAARSVLPNCTETKLVFGANLRAWRHILELRGSPHAEAEIRRWACRVAELFLHECPNAFQDFMVHDGAVVVDYHKV